MSGADDQRAAERLRDVVVCHCYEIAGPVGGGHWASCLAEEIGDEVTAVLVDRDRLRAELEHVTGLLAEARTHRGNALDFARERQRELAETRAELHGATGAAAVLRERGDALADATNALLDQWRWLNERSRPDGASTCETRLVEWRSVRGDAPTAPAADVRDPASETHRTSAAPTAAPDVRAWEDDGDWGWACSRCGYRSVAWWADRATARRAAHEHGRDRCPAAGGSSPASTDGGEQ